MTRKAWAAAGVVVLTVLAIAVVFWGTQLGGSTTIGIVPPRNGAMSVPISATPNFVYFCGPEGPSGVKQAPIGVQIPDGHGGGALWVSVGSTYSTAGALPAGHRLRITRRWFRPTRYEYVADDGASVTLHPTPLFAHSCP